MKKYAAPEWHGRSTCAADSWPRSGSMVHRQSCHGDVDDRAEEKEDDELEHPALHDNILRRNFPSPSAFGAASQEVPAQVVAALDAAATLAADDAAQREW